MLRRRAAVVAAVAAVGLVGAGASCFARFALQQDFAAYWIAGAARGAELDPYVNHVGLVAGMWDGVAPFQHSRFLYPPLAAELFRPLAALPFPLAKALFTGGAVLAWLATALLFERRGRTPFLIAGGLFFPLYLHLERGQIDLFLLPLLAGAWRARHRAVAAGVALAVAALFKPALLGMLPVLVALRLGRWLAGVAAGGALLLAATLAVSGPALAWRYATEVVPRAALYGEGGTEEMLLPEDRFPVAPAGAAEPERVTIGGASYRISLWQVPASASLPRLLAPSTPAPLTSLAPYLFAAAALIAVARRRPPPTDDRAALLYFAAAVACVVTSPAGWAMGLVWALPLAPLAMGVHAGSGLDARVRLVLGAAGIACAVPAPFPGFPAIAGAALVLAAAAAARPEAAE